LLPSKSSSLHCVTCFRVSSLNLLPSIDLCFLLEVLFNLLASGVEFREADTKVGDNLLPELRPYWGCGITERYELACVI
jgi:hypothetical protein